MKSNEMKTKRSVADLKFKYSGGNFSCNGRKLTSLEGSPSTVDGDFWGFDNQLTSLEGSPSSIGGSFYCRKNRLTSLKGAPSSIGGDFYCSGNLLTSLQDIHKHLKHVGNGGLFLNGNPIKSHVLGVLLIKGLETVIMDNKEVEAILSKHLPSHGLLSVLQAQEELVDAGLNDFAQL